jgi:hypothetical protein
MPGASPKRPDGRLSHTNSIPGRSGVKVKRFGKATRSPRQGRPRGWLASRRVRVDDPLDGGVDVPGLNVPSVSLYELDRRAQFSSDANVARRGPARRPGLRGVPLHVQDELRQRLEAGRFAILDMFDNRELPTYRAQRTHHGRLRRRRCARPQAERLRWQSYARAGNAPAASSPGAGTKTSPRNYPGSCSQREPKRPKRDAVRSVHLRGGRLWRLGSSLDLKRAHNPKVAGSNPAPATMNDEGLADAGAANPFRLPRLHPGIATSRSMRRPDASQDSFARRRPGSSR